MNRTVVLKAIADETRMELLTMLLKNNCCVRALARRLGMTEDIVLQHLKILREAGLLTGERHDHLTHYNVKHSVLRELTDELEALAAIERMTCMPEKGKCEPAEKEVCHIVNSKCGCCHTFCTEECK